MGPEVLCFLPTDPAPSPEAFQEELAVPQIILPTVPITLNFKKLPVKITTVVLKGKFTCHQKCSGIRTSISATEKSGTA